MKLETFHGEGSVTIDGKELSRSPFKITIYPFQISIEMEQIPIEIFLTPGGTLEGALDNGAKIRAGGLVLGLGEKEVVANRIEIGNEIRILNKSAFQLTGYYGNNFEFEHRGFQIFTSDQKNFNLEKSHYEKWRILRPGLTLNLKKNPHDKEASFEIGRAICTLLSIATGNDVIINKQIFEDSLLIFRRMKGSFYSFNSIIPDHNIGDYIIQTLQKWEQLSPEDKGLIRNLTIYINSAGDEKDYIDDRIFRLAQAWEMATKLWGEKNDELPIELNKLKIKLKKAWKEWRNEHPESDKTGFWFGRIAESLKWESLIEKLQNIFNQFNFKESMISIDFRMLKDKVRDKVAHEGKMIVFDKPYDLLEASRLGLRLIILKKLGYEGVVQFTKNKYRHFT